MLVADNRHAEDIVRIAASETSLSQDGFSIGNGDSSHCGHCGTSLRYVALLKHPSSHEYIFVGEQCLGNRFSLTKDQFADLRLRASVERNGGTMEIDTRTAAERDTDAAIAAAARLARVKEGVESIVEAHPILAWLTYADEIAAWESVDVKRYSRLLMGSGALSERQISQAKDSLSTSLRQREYRAHADRRRESMPDFGAGIDDVFTVEHVRTSPSKFGEGTFTSVLLAHDCDWKVWATVSEGSPDLVSGSRVHLKSESFANSNQANVFYAKGKSKITESTA